STARSAQRENSEAKNWLSAVVINERPARSARGLRLTRTSLPQAPHHRFGVAIVPAQTQLERADVSPRRRQQRQRDTRGNQLPAPDERLRWPTEVVVLSKERRQLRPGPPLGRRE